MCCVQCIFTSVCRAETNSLWFCLYKTLAWLPSWDCSRLLSWFWRWTTNLVSTFGSTWHHIKEWTRRNRFAPNNLSTWLTRSTSFCRGSSWLFLVRCGKLVSHEDQEVGCWYQWLSSFFWLFWFCQSVSRSDLNWFGYCQKECNFLHNFNLLPIPFL